MGITRKIAHNGMKGRKRVTLLLVLVLAFTFLFIVSIITLETSINETKQNQRIELYGEWKAALMEADEKQVGKLSEKKSVDKFAVSTLVGDATDCGTVGTISEDLMELGNLKLQAGTLPKADNEILLEANVADALGVDEPVGETITVNIVKPLVNLDKESFLKDKTQSTYRYQFYNHETVEDMDLNLRTQYCLALPEEERVSPEKILEDGYLYDQDITITKDFVVCGVLDSYANSWDSGNFSLANSFITKESSQKILAALRGLEATDLSDYHFTSNLFLGSKEDSEIFYQSFAADYLSAEELEEIGEEGSSSTAAFRKNSYAYPTLTGKVENTTMRMVLLLIFIASASGIFQIFLTQMKKRTRKIALLKSIGTTQGQIVAMELWEGVYLLLYSMPIGIVLGLLASKAMIAGMNGAAAMDISFYLNLQLLLAGIFLGIQALFLGMMIPVLYAIGVPLVGSVSVGKKKHKKTAPGQKRKQLNFNEITRIHNRFNRGQVTMGRLLAFLMAVILFGCEYMAYDAFRDYRDRVQLEKRPDYVITAPHGNTDRNLKKLCEQLEAENKGTSTQWYKMAHSFINYENIEESELLNAYKKALPSDVYKKYIGVVPQESNGQIVPDYAPLLVDGCVINNVYAIDTDSDYYKELLEAVTVGEVDENAFYRGESVILAIPLYQGDTASVTQLAEGSVPAKLDLRQAMENVLNTAGIHLSYRSAYRDSYQQDTSIQPGDSLYVSQQFESITAGSQSLDYNGTMTTVAGIIYYMPEESIYPFFENNMGYTVIAASGFMNHFCPNANLDPTGLGWSNSEEAFQFMLQEMPTNLGKSAINIYSGKNRQDAQEAASVFKFARDNGFEFENYSEENWNLYYKALNAAMIIGMLGVTAVVIAMIILININMSAFEQERPRIGVLQALGITQHDFSMNYFKTGLKNAMGSLVAVHLILLVVLLLQSVVTMGASLSLLAEYFKNIWSTGLYGYPWLVHILLCVLYLTITVWNFYLPARQLRRYSPDENINGTVK